MELVIAVDDPRAPDVRSLLEAHLSFASEMSPAEHVHALDTDGLLDPSITFFSARRDGVLVGVGAIKQLDETHTELKSMHTATVARRQGVGRAMVEHLVSIASALGCARVSIETGTTEAFASARAMYEQRGFRTCEPFGQYTLNPYSTCMTIFLDTAPRGNEP